MPSNSDQSGRFTEAGIGSLAGARAGIALWTERQKTRLSVIADRIRDVVSAAESTELDASTDDSIPRMELPDDEYLDPDQARNSDLRDRTRL